MNIIKYIDGNKTYLAGLIAVGLGIYTKNMEFIMLGLIGMGLRHGIEKGKSV